MNSSWPKGGLPKSLWETISAFANTEGGTVVLGVAEKGEGYEIVGVRSPAKLIKAFWDGHNNPQKFSPAICTEGDVQLVPIDGRELLLIRVRRAARAQRPVFVNGNPLTGTYKRNFEGDYHCTEAEVRQMLRDASDEPQDGMVLEGFGLEDLDAESLRAYCNRFASHEPDHPFLALEDRALMERLGGWRRERVGGRAGLTQAGLLMFGSERSLLDELPHYHLDYQEQLSADPEQRWSHRITVDGKWEPNLFNFYYRVYPRLVEGLAENPALEMTRVWLPLASMIQSDVEQELRAIFGDAYRGLDELGRVILMLAHRFDEIGNADIQPYRAEHPREIGVRPKQFVEAGWLEKSGHGRGTRYRWAAAADRRDGRVQDPMRSPPAQGLAGRDDRRSNAQLGYAHAHYGYDQKCSGASTEGVRGEPRGRAVLRHAAARAGVAVRPARPQLLRHRVDRPGGCWLGRRSA